MPDPAALSMVCADTTRSRAYLQNLTRTGLRLAHVLVLSPPGEALSGQSAAALPDRPAGAAADALWRQAHFDPNSDLSADLQALGANVSRCDSGDINDPRVVAAIADLPGEVVVYSGFGGQILRRDVLEAGKRFLHVHGGYLPDYPGSTTNYYSLIADGSLGASAIFLTSYIDAGPILLRRRFPAPPDLKQIDHLHDAAARSVVLCAVLEIHSRTGNWPHEDIGSCARPDPFYIIHPVLKHLAVFGPRSTE